MRGCVECYGPYKEQSTAADLNRRRGFLCVEMRTRVHARKRPSHDAVREPLSCWVMGLKDYIR